jgi:hypothetical protein
VRSAPFPIPPRRDGTASGAGEYTDALGHTFYADMLRIAIVAPLLFAATAAARPAPVEVTFDAKIEAIGAAPGFLCGGFMATQALEVAVTKVDRGPLKSKTKTTVRVMVCTLGPLLRPNKDGLPELDPDKIRVGSLIHLDAEEYGRSEWLTTTDKIVVTTR